ncbi:MAG TPA: prepilin-type N-terminal cleavage/methylation domain-containing protein [Candidatus Saccharibacteria bacterium]|nr:prepilin-type N-terminal cleavage/methylation domain-containing protein [Candidatus Saccharibacteria bacterium]HRK94551.1 prepilin-type N-terminal cleavage/methylation domain-containing protein [Candidatus Saccharibacteria bacterium]
MKYKFHPAFTIIELIVVITVVGIIAAVSTFAWRSWSASAAQKEVQSDLRQAASAMESAKNFGSGYPTSIPSSFKPGSGVSVTYFSGNATTYCIQAQSTRISSVQYYVNSASGQTPLQGTCAAGGGGGGGGSYAGPTSIWGCAQESGGYNIGWPSLASSAIPSFHVVINPGAQDEIDAIVPNDLSSEGTFVYDLGPGGGGGSYDITVEYINTSDEYSDPTNEVVTFYGADCYS